MKKKNCEDFTPLPEDMEWHGDKALDCLHCLCFVGNGCPYKEELNA